MPATNQQVQTFVDTRIRPHCQLLRQVYLALKDDKAVIGDVYENVAGTPDWNDNRTDGPPHLLTPSDVLAFNTFITDFIAFIESGDGAAQWPAILSACVHAP